MGLRKNGGRKRQRDATVTNGGRGRQKDGLVEGIEHREGGAIGELRNDNNGNFFFCF